MPEPGIQVFRTILCALPDRSGALDFVQIALCQVIQRVAFHLHITPVNFSADAGIVNNHTGSGILDQLEKGRVIDLRANNHEPDSFASWAFGTRLYIPNDLM